MHTCYCHKQLQKHASPLLSLLSGGGLCAVCRVVTRRTWLAVDGPERPPEPVGGGTSCSCNCQLERTEEEREKWEAPARVAPP